MSPVGFWIFFLNSYFPNKSTKNWQWKKIVRPFDFRCLQSVITNRFEVTIDHPQHVRDWDVRNLSKNKSYYVENWKYRIDLKDRFQRYFKNKNTVNSTFTLYVFTNSNYEFIVIFCYLWIRDNSKKNRFRFFFSKI